MIRGDTMEPLVRCRKFVVGMFVALFALGHWGLADAMTQEELVLEALREKVAAHDKMLGALERIDWFGDFRLRYEIKNRANDNSLANDSDSAFDTARPRIRLRFGAKAHLYKDLDLIFRLSTGGNQGTSGNRTLGGTFDQEPIDLNLAYVSYKPSKWNLNGLTLEGGKVKNQFMKSEMVWDSDVTFEGITESYERKHGDTKLKLVFGQYILEETDRTPTTGGRQPVDDPLVIAWQGQAHQKTSFGKFKFAVAFYDYQNLTDNAITNQLGAGDGQRNSQVTATNVNTTNIRTLDFMGQWSTPLAGCHLKVFGEYAVNVDADAPAGNNTIADDLDTAWEVGAQFGHNKFKKFGDWKLKAMYRLVQQDAVFYALADSDFHDGGVNYKGVELQAKMALRKGIQINYTFWNAQNERGDVNGGKLDMNGMHQFDLKFKF
ncbi:hypothetical protein UZ36_04700 [Candidatus Nitromaritima sp. SCGC AAA799-C22]|nr:hypothetical protein UZ36_04700 [Candidatus Nitromaritima sp. SCGC AAA799-C22]